MSTHAISRQVMPSAIVVKWGLNPTRACPGMSWSSLVFYSLSNGSNFSQGSRALELGSSRVERQLRSNSISRIVDFKSSKPTDANSFKLRIGSEVFHGFQPPQFHPSGPPNFVRAFIRFSKIHPSAPLMGGYAG
jgi:hypothetical protein